VVPKKSCSCTDGASDTARGKVRAGEVCGVEMWVDNGRRGQKWTMYVDHPEAGEIPFQMGIPPVLVFFLVGKGYETMHV
jgi:hypothetical protein